MFYNEINTILFPRSLASTRRRWEKLVIYSLRRRQDVAISGNILEHLRDPQQLRHSKGTGNCLLFGWKWKISNKTTGRDLISDFDSNWNLGLLLLRYNSQRFSWATLEDCQHWQFSRIHCVRRHYNLINSHNFYFPTQNLEFGTKAGCYRREGEDLVSVRWGKIIRFDCMASHRLAPYNKLSIFILFSGGCIIIKSLAPYFSSYYHCWSSPARSPIAHSMWPKIYSYIVMMCVAARQFPF